MTEPIKEQVDEIARGEDETTPFKLFAAMHVVVGLGAGVLIAAVTFLWWYLAR